MPITYKDAGVDIDSGELMVERIKPLASQVRTPEVLDALGRFAGSCSLPPGLKDPILVASTDGVGTKLDVARRLGQHESIGIDLVAMCVNDIGALGARPLFFLDYLATGKLDVAMGEAIIRGIVEGCRQARCALLGGETAEMPGMYRMGSYDLAGFAVGVVEKHRLIDGKSIQSGDIIVAVASSGIHSNGLSLARKVVEIRFADDYQKFIPELGTTIGTALLEPTRIYTQGLKSFIEALGDQVHGISHITGGGLQNNVPRMLPEGVCAELDMATYERPALFRWLQRCGPIEESEMRRTFNLGIGLCVVIPAHALDLALEAWQKAGQKAWQVGRIVPRKPGAPPIHFVER